MFVSSRSVLLSLLLGAIFISPVAVGALDALPFAPVGIALAVFAAYAFGRAGRWRSKQFSLVLLSACFAVTLFDLAARPLAVILPQALNR